MIIFYICLFFIGASITSFINATVYRIENNYPVKELITKPSHCESCNKVLTWYELIPVLGFLLQKGSCPRCKEKINTYYPISEFLLGISFALFYIYSVPWYLWILLVSLFVLSFYDFIAKSIPKNIVHVLLLFSVIVWIFIIQDWSTLLAPAITVLIFSILNLFKKSMGIGDLLMIGVIGILFSYEQFLVFFWLAIFVAFIYSLVLIIIKKINIKKATLPMIPFFAISFIITCLYGVNIFELLVKYICI